MIKNKRKALRRPVRYKAWLGLKPDEVHGCALHDISESGARIDVVDSKMVPDRFVLLLSGNGAARRTCNVVWREAKQVGVKFERRLAASERATLVPALDADIGVTVDTALPSETVEPT